MRNMLFRPVVCIIIVVILGTCGFHLFSDPLDELTRGCDLSKGFPVVLYDTYRCHNKPWSRVEKNFSDEFRVYTKGQYVFAYFYDDFKGEWHDEKAYYCKILSSPYIEENNKWYEISDDSRYVTFFDSCNKRECIKKIKDTLNSSEYAWTKLKNKPQIVEYLDLDDFGARKKKRTAKDFIEEENARIRSLKNPNNLSEIEVQKTAEVAKNKEEDRFESYRINKQEAQKRLEKTIERLKNEN